MEICSADKCTGCAACYNVCGHHAIEMQEDELGHLYPFVDEKKCIRCMLCHSSCPVNNKPRLVYPKKCYAVALLDENDLHESASGGAATAMLREMLQNRGIVYGCSGEDIFNVQHIRVDHNADVEKLRGSQYVQSNIGDIYKKVKADLQAHYEVLFIGTPCQVAGLKSYLRKNYPNLTTADLVCHGVPSQKMLTENIRSYISDLDGRKFKVSFRRKYHVNKNGFQSTKIEYGWFLQNQQHLNINRKYYNDSYMFGFLQGLTFRESCYTCRYATSARCSDITLADFWGLGNDAGFEKGKGVSLCLVNSDKGQNLIELINPYARVIERDVVEAIMGNGQLQCPSRKNKAHNIFRSFYPTYGLNTAIQKSLRKERLQLSIINPIGQKMKELVMKLLRPFKRLIVNNLN